jgi:hypothetical protein
VCRCAGWPKKQEEVLRKKPHNRKPVRESRAEKKLVSQPSKSANPISTGFSDFIFVCGVNNFIGRVGPLVEKTGREKRGKLTGQSGCVLCPSSD